MWATGDGIIAGKIFQTGVTELAIDDSLSCGVYSGLQYLAGFTRRAAAIKIVSNTGRRKR
jgi:hypothetical protein